MEQQVHIFGSGLGSSRAEKSKEELLVIMKNLDLNSDFTFCVVCDIEEVKRGDSLEEVEKNKEEARKIATSLLKVLGSTEGFEKYKGLIIRVNPIESDEYRKDVKYFQSLEESEKNTLKGVYVPDFEHHENIMKASRDLNIEPHKIMPIIETEEGHNNLTDIANALLKNSNGNEVYMIGTGDAYHRFLDRAKNDSLGEEKDIYLTPDTSLGEDTASILAHTETVHQIVKLNQLNVQGNLNLMLATSTLVDEGQNPGDLTGMALELYNDQKNYELQEGDKRNMRNNIGKVTIHPSQMFLSDHYKNTGEIDSTITPLSHNFTSEETVDHYLMCKKERIPTILRGYIILDAQFYIALFKEFKKYGVYETVQKYPLLKSYMGADSSLLLESIFDIFADDIKSFSY